MKFVANLLHNPPPASGGHSLTDAPSFTINYNLCLLFTFKVKKYKNRINVKITGITF